jgi:hypothetical protein
MERHGLEWGTDDGEDVRIMGVPSCGRWCDVHIVRIGRGVMQLGGDKSSGGRAFALSNQQGDRRFLAGNGFMARPDDLPYSRFRCGVYSW